MYYTYVLRCIDELTKNKIFYIGSTGNLKQRLDRHKNGGVETTKDFNKIELVYYEACKNKTDARKRELQLKTGFGRGYISKRIAEYLKEDAVIV